MVVVRGGEGDMTRRRLKLGWIPVGSARNASLRKRREGLMKKVKELSILCDVQAFVIIYSPNERIPLGWPSPHEIHGMYFSRFINVPEARRDKFKVDQEKSLEDRLLKTKEHLARIYKDNKKMEMSQLMLEVTGNSFQGIEKLDDINEICGLLWLLDEMSKEVTKAAVEYYKSHQVNVDLSINIGPPKDVIKKAT
ncbi:agamous-like MADS-box protein AGL80 [Rutidosis leptorrhynchoides]|uniref:agamous-like MADS-box protein AGL80 n=1 Tax=Rutidosis leptorrhynchoides TaxID=125765 RepID=UPI003A9A1900